MKPLNEINTILLKEGYVSWDTANIFPQGMTHIYKKFPFIISFYQDNQGGEPFWVFELERIQQIEPSDLSRPVFFGKVTPLFEEHLEKLQKYEAIINRGFDAEFSIQ